MRIADFDYELPAELIAQRPLEKRDAARMLVLNRAHHAWRDSQFAELPTHIRAGDVVVVNNTRVFPARLVGTREPTGGRVELFLIRESDKGVWEALTRPAKRLQKGTRISFGKRLRAEVIEVLDEGRRRVRFDSAESFDALLEELGQTPLPPYIKRDQQHIIAADAGQASEAANDRARYQTVYARHSGAIAAPTAGLHFTTHVIDELAARGAHIVEVTLHVGYGTFEPVRVDLIDEHKVAPERCEITIEAARKINDARASGNRIFAVGTTTVRALESALDADGLVRAGAREANITITPGHRFQAVDALLTNFHLPRSSLLLLVAAFAGQDFALQAYRHAVAARYRFYSYGDCMLII